MSNKQKRETEIMDTSPNTLTLGRSFEGAKKSKRESSTVEAFGVILIRLIHDARQQAGMSIEELESSCGIRAGLLSAEDAWHRVNLDELWSISKVLDASLGSWVRRAGGEDEALCAIPKTRSVGRRMIVRSGIERAWKRPDPFRLIEVCEREQFPYLAGFEQYVAFPVQPNVPDGIPAEGHPAYSANIGDRWQFNTEDGLTPVYEFKGIFKVVREIGDPNEKQVLIEEVL
jgi:hypothetical protein